MRLARERKAATSAPKRAETIANTTGDGDADRGSRHGRIAATFRVKSTVLRCVFSRHTPWQNGFAERWVGTARREIVDHVIVLGERHLRRILREYVAYYNADRPHMSLDGDAPTTRDVEPPSLGPVIAMRRLGGLHHRYRRVAA